MFSPVLFSTPFLLDKRTETNLQLELRVEKKVEDIKNALFMVLAFFDDNCHSVNEEINYLR